MNDTICYKIQKAHFLPYETVIDKKLMEVIEASNETIASSRVYLVCSISQQEDLGQGYSKPKVLYVGETFNKSKRYSSHEKLLKATALKGHNEVLWVYFIHMRFMYMGQALFKNDPFDVFNEIKDLNSKTSVQLLERFFIKLFTPILNEKNNNQKIKSDNLIDEKLIQNGIEFVNLDVGMDDYIFNFVGGNRTENIDRYTFSLLTDELL